MMLFLLLYDFWLYPSKAGSSGRASWRSYVVDKRDYDVLRPHTKFQLDAINRLRDMAFLKLIFSE